MAQTETEILQSLVPEPTVENITFESNRSGDSKGIAVRIVYSISDVVNQDAVGTWFKQKEYENYFLIRTRLECDGDIDEHYDVPALVYTDANISTGVSGIEATPVTQIFDTVLGKMVESRNDSNVSKFTFEKIYYVDKQPESMTFYVITSFNIFQMEQDFGIDLFRSERRDTEKTEKIEIYRNEQLQYPVQDFRIREDIKKFEFSEQRASDFDFLSRQVSVKKERDDSYVTDFISDLWITRNAQGEAKFVFVFNAASFFEKRSEYKDIYRRLTSVEKYNLIRQIQVSSLKIKRKRVKVIQNKHGRSVMDFKDEPVLEEIVETRRLPNRDGFEKVVTSTGSAMQISVTGVSDSPLDDNNLIFITGTDYDIADVTDGVYSYGVSIEVIDTTRQILLNKLGRLSESISLMKKVLAGSIRPEFYDARTDLYTRPLEEIVSDTSENSESEIREFKSTKDRARDIYRTFIGRPRLRGGGTIVQAVQDAQLIADETLRKIGDLLRMDKIKSPKELEVIIEVMESLLANAASSIGESSDYYEGRLSPAATDARILAEKFYTSPDKLFDSNIPNLEGREYLSNFNTSTSESVLREISSLSRDNGEVGLRVINGAEYTDRLKQEIEKFFPKGTTEVSLPMLGGTPGSNNISLTGTGSEFLSVQAFMQAKEDNSIFAGLTDASANNIIRNDILSNANSHFPGTPVTTDVSVGERPEAAYLALRGASFSVANGILLEQDSGASNSTSRTADSPDVSIEPIEPQTPLTIKKERDFEKFIFEKVSREIKSSLSRSSLVSAANTLSPPPGSIFSGLTVPDRRRVMESAPNQVVSYSTFSGTPDEPAYVVTSEFLTKISYLSGFEFDEVKQNVSLPKWESLTFDVYSSNADRNLLCRINPYHMDDLGIRATNSRYPIYDAFFIIRPVDGFLYEYVESTPTVQPNSVSENYLEEQMRLFQAELQELVTARFHISLLLINDQQLLMEKALTPLLEIARDRDNYGHNAWNIHQGNLLRNEGDRFSLILQEVESALLSIDDEGGWFSPRNRMNLIKTSTQRYYDNYENRLLLIMPRNQDVDEKQQEIREAGFTSHISTSRTGQPIVNVMKRRGE